MTREQFDEGLRALGDFYEKGIVTRIYAVTGPGKGEGYLIFDNVGIRHNKREWGIFINSPEVCQYLPYESIIALSGVTRHKLCE